jgi:hypothetical protein
MSRKNRVLYVGEIITTSKDIAEKRIPVSEDVWKALHGMRKPGQTYDSLLREMIPVYKIRAIPDYGDVIILEQSQKEDNK